MISQAILERSRIITTVNYVPTLCETLLPSGEQRNMNNYRKKRIH